MIDDLFIDLAIDDWIIASSFVHGVINRRFAQTSRNDSIH
jgi:hypothetical protein